MILLMSKRPNCCWGVRNHFKPENDELVKQTVGFVGTFDLTRALSAEALLQNTTTTAY